MKQASESRIGRKLKIAKPNSGPTAPGETRPGPEVNDDAGLIDYMKGTIQTSWHMVGTCKMGVDDMAVVDPQLTLFIKYLGYALGAWLALRGLRTLDVRLRQHQASALKIARWLGDQNGNSA